MRMTVVDVELRNKSSMLSTHLDPATCAHAWEPHLWEYGRAYCPRCGSFARWVDDPRLEARP